MNGTGNFGIKIKLKKINPNYGDATTNNRTNTITNEFVALGHYDAIEVEKVDRLSDFRPGKEMEQREAEYFSQDLRNANYYTEYTLKLLAINELDEFKAEYLYWSNVGNKDLPFMSIISVDIKDEFLKCITIESPTSQYVKIIKEICEQKEANSNISITPYFCLGFTDFVIMVRSNSLIAIQTFIEAIRKNEKVSSTYTVFGLKKIQNCKNISKENKISVKFQWSFKDIAAGSDRILFFEQLKKTGIKFLSTCGVFDNIAEGEISECEFYKLFSVVNPYFDKDDKPYGRVKNFNTYINFSETKAGKNLNTSSSEQKNDKVLNTLQDFLTKYKILIDKINSHKRLYKAMKEMGRYYGHIAFTCHSLDVQKVFGGFYIDFLQSLTHIVEQLIELVNNEEQGIAVEIENLDAAIEEFRNLFGTLLFDILRSDHSFFEAPSIAHPSIGSTTKLLLAYNNIVNEWNKQIVTTDGHHYVSFLVTSGGCDKTKAHNLLYKFEEMVPIKKSSQNNGLYKLPVIITISEASLYDIEGTLFRLAHEFFHLKGNRDRVDRYYGYYKGLFYEYIDYCCHFIENESNITKGKSICIDGNREEIIEISAKDFKNKFDSWARDRTGTEYKSLNDFLNELGSGGRLAENDLKTYEKIVSPDLNILLFSPMPAYANFQKTLLSDKLNFESIYKSFKDNFTYQDGYERRLKVIDTYNDNFSHLFAGVFKDFEFNAISESHFLARINKILGSVPYDSATYINNTATYIPQMIGELSDIYAQIEFEKNEENRKKAKSKCGLIYDYYDDGKDYYNQTGFKEYSDACGGGIKTIPPQSEFYARLWIRATIAFFQDEDNSSQIGIHAPYNKAGYEDLLYILYKECFADVCALNAFKVKYQSLEELTALYLAAFIFEQRNLKLFLELSSSDQDKPIHLLLALRIAVVLSGIIGFSKSNQIKVDIEYVVNKIWDRVKDVFNNQEGSTSTESEYVFKKDMRVALERIISIYNGMEVNNELSGYSNHIYICELVNYIKNRIKVESKNNIEYPKFKAENDYTNVRLISDLWLRSYFD